MKTNALALFAFLFTGFLNAQDTALDNFTEAFPATTVGFFHVYALGDVDPESDYLLTGVEMGGSEIALLPRKFRKIAERKGGKMYAAAAVRDGNGDDMYLVRTVTETSQRVDVFTIKNNTVKHGKLLAYESCRGNNCRQLDSYLTDVNGDTRFELIQIARKAGGQVARATYVLDTNDKWKKTTQLDDTPWESIDFYEGE